MIGHSTQDMVPRVVVGPRYRPRPIGHGVGTAEAEQFERSSRVRGSDTLAGVDPGDSLGSPLAELYVVYERLMDFFAAGQDAFYSIGDLAVATGVLPRSETYPAMQPPPSPRARASEESSSAKGGKVGGDREKPLPRGAAKRQRKRAKAKKKAPPAAPVSASVSGKAHGAAWATEWLRVVAEHYTASARAAETACSVLIDQNASNTSAASGRTAAAAIAAALRQSALQAMKDASSVGAAHRVDPATSESGNAPIGPALNASASTANAAAAVATAARSVSEGTGIVPSRWALPRMRRMAEYLSLVMQMEAEGGVYEYGRDTLARGGTVSVSAAVGDRHSHNGEGDFTSATALTTAYSRRLGRRETSREWSRVVWDFHHFATEREARRTSREDEDHGQGAAAAAMVDDVEIVKDESRPLSSSSRGALGQRFDPLLHETTDGGMVHPNNRFAWHEKGQKQKAAEDELKLWRHKKYGITVQGEVQNFVWMARGLKKKAKAKQTSPLGLPPL